MFFPASLLLDPNIVIQIRQAVRAPFFPDRVREFGISETLSISGDWKAGAAFVCGFWVPEVSAALRALGPRDWIPSMPVELELPASDFPLEKGDKTKQSPFAPGHHKLAGFESSTLIDLLDFHRFLLKETGLEEPRLLQKKPERSKRMLMRLGEAN
jgi:hypothetical protein